MEEKWIYLFLKHLQNTATCSLNTIQAYGHDLRLYRDYLKITSSKDNQKDSKSINRNNNNNNSVANHPKEKDWTPLYAFMHKKGLGTRSQVRVLSCLKSYFKFLQSKQIATPDFSSLSSPKFKNTLPHWAHENHFLKLLQACSKTPNPHIVARNQFSLKLLFGLGCRVSELIAINTTDYQLSPPWIKLKGKGQKERLLPLTKELQLALKNYIVHHRADLLKHKSRETALILNNRGKRPSRVDIWRWLKKWACDAGLDEKLSPHAFRHGFATRILQNGGDLRSVQALLGHSSIQTTQVYTHLQTKDLNKAILKHHPLCKKKNNV